MEWGDLPRTARIVWKKVESMSNDTLGDRMKNYEGVPRSRLVPKTPVIMRLDGRAFHTFTKGMKRPVDLRMQRCMVETAAFLCKEISGAAIAYTQSDEISILLVDYKNVQTQGWFDYEVQKMASVAAAMATVKFYETYLLEFGLDNPHLARNLPTFDCRVWNLPKHEVVNYFIWRQQDCTRNSISMLAQANFSHKQLQNQSQEKMQDMLVLEKGINWNDCPVAQKRGICVRKFIYQHFGGAEITTRSKWEADMDIPIFTQDRNYIQDLTITDTAKEAV